jgi:predicted amidohydrolase YtcJ
MLPAAWMCVALVLAGGAAQGGAAAADSVFANGNVHTMNPAQPHATAIAVKGGRIVFVGSDREARRHAGPGARVVDLRGATVVPGLTDSHVHLNLLGGRLAGLDLAGTRSPGDLAARVAARVRTARRGAWITGSGWSEGEWRPSRLPTRRDLDPISPANPVFLRRGDYHSGIANSVALRIARIDRRTPDPSGGAIQKDPRTGEPTGLLSGNAQALVMRHIPGPNEAELRRQLLLAAERSVARCVTEVHQPGGTYMMVNRLRWLYARGLLKLRIHQAVSGPGPDANRLLREGLRPRTFGDRLALRSIKLLIDGSLGSRTAALLEPYHGTRNHGSLRGDFAAIRALLAAALRRGIQVQTHAIGDRANRVALDLYAQAFRAVPPAQRRVRDPRWRIEHAQIVHPADLPRFAALGVIPSMQPSHAISDLRWTASRLGPARLDRAYPWRSFLQSGAIIAGGSDAPVESGNPMVELYAAVARRGLDGYRGPGWHPEEAVTREQALKMLTVWAARAAFEEDLRGSIEPGKLADLSVLSADVLRVPVSEIPRTRCLMTVINGEVVFRAGL